MVDGHVIPWKSLLSARCDLPIEQPETRSAIWPSRWLAARQIARKLRGSESYGLGCTDNPVQIPVQIFRACRLCERTIRRLDNHCVQATIMRPDLSPTSIACRRSAASLASQSRCISTITATRISTLGVRTAPPKSESTLGVIEGDLKRRQLRLVLAWAELHQAELLENWQRARLVGHSRRSTLCNEPSTFCRYRRLGRPSRRPAAHVR